MSAPRWMHACRETIARATGLTVVPHRPQRREEHRVLAWMNELSLDLLIDVGANAGQFTADLYRAGYRGRVVSFEPQARAHERLMTTARRHAGWHVAPRCALGAKTGSLALHVTANSVSSSPLPPGNDPHAAAAGTRVVTHEQTAVERLDSVLPRLMPDVDQPLFLKLDTQGYELQVLAGATGVMPRISAMLIECSLSQLYAGAPLIGDIFRWTEQAGLIACDAIPEYYAPDGRMLQMDLIFRRLS